MNVKPLSETMYFEYGDKIWSNCTKFASNLLERNIHKGKKFINIL
jgi:hypothetical protein